MHRQVPQLTLHRFIKAGRNQLTFDQRSSATEACCYGGDRLLTNFCYPRERQRKCPASFRPAYVIRCSIDERYRARF